MIDQKFEDSLDFKNQLHMIGQNFKDYEQFNTSVARQANIQFTTVDKAINAEALLTWMVFFGRNVLTWSGFTLVWTSTNLHLWTVVAYGQRTLDRFRSWA